MKLHRLSAMERPERPSRCGDMSSRAFDFFSVRPNADFGAVTASIRFFNGFHSYRGSKVTKNHEKNSGFPKDEGNPIIMGFQGEKRKTEKSGFQKMKEILL